MTTDTLLMSGTIPQLILYPLYPGGPQVKASGGAFNASASYKTQANRFVPAYGVNLPNNLRANEADSYFTLSGTHTISRRPEGTLKPYSGKLGFDPTVTGGLTKASVPAVAPTIPNLYKKAEKLLSVSELKMTDLLAQPEFRIPSIGMGLKVTTDGVGGVDKVQLDPGGRGLLARQDATSPAFGGLNSAEISRKAIFSLTDLGINTGPARINAVQPGSPQPALNPLQSNLQTPLNGNQLTRPNGLNTLENLEAKALLALQDKNLDLDGLSIELERLYELQANNQRLDSAVKFGPDAIQSQQLAATQAGLGVNTSERFQANVVGLINASKQSENYTASLVPKADQLMNGRIPGAPWVQGQSAGNMGGALGNASSFEMGAAVADAMSRKGKGSSYIPFRMSSDGQSGQGFGDANPFMGGGNTGTGGGASSSFGGQTGQQQYRPRKPLAFTP